MSSSSGKIVYLEVNDSGGWRRVTSFDLLDYSDGELEHRAHQLLEMSVSHRLKARIIIPGEGAPLLHWTRACGWVEWVHPGLRATTAEAGT